MRQVRPRRGFTLIELLVVIGIIAVLVSMLMPSFGRLRALARQTVCAANLRSQGTAMLNYVAQTGFYPGHAGRSSSGHIVAVWPLRMREFLDGNQDVFWCPGELEGFQWQKTSGGSGDLYATAADTGYGYKSGELLLDVFQVPFSYGYNDWGVARDGQPPPDGVRQRGLGGDLFVDLQNFRKDSHELDKARVRSPEAMIAISDNTTDGSWDYNIDPDNPREAPGRIHNGGSNVLFCDGHVQWFLQKDLMNIDPSRPGGETMNRMWNNDRAVHY